MSQIDQISKEETVNFCWINVLFNLLELCFYGSASAFFVTQTLRALARDGRTVIASIHQPSSEVFELFDQLYLLSGGKTVYFGQASDAYEVSSHLNFYFDP